MQDLSIEAFLTLLREKGIQLTLAGDRIRCNAPKGALSEEIQRELSRRKADLQQTLRRAQDAQSAGPILERADRDKPLPLSFAQQRLWFLNQLDPESTAYNLPLTLPLSGALDQDKLQQTFAEIVRRHEILRTTFHADDGQPVQRISPLGSVPLDIRDFTALPPAEMESAITRTMTEEMIRPYDLSRGPLLRAVLMALSDNAQILLILFHHIITDGWSMANFRKEFEALYNAPRHGPTPPLPELRFQYADYAASQRTWWHGEVLQRQLAYWKKRLSGDLPVLRLPMDRERPAVQTSRGATQYFSVSKDVSDGFKALAQAGGATVFMALLGAFNVLLHRYAGDEDVLVGIPDGNRHLQDLETMQGLFVNTLVIRGDLSGRPSFREVLKRVHRTALEAYEHRDLPFEALVEALKPERSLSRAPLFQVMFVMQNTPLQAYGRSGAAFENTLTVEGIARFDLTVYVVETDHGFDFGFEYNRDLFDDATITRLTGHWERLLRGIVAQPDLCIARLPLLSEAELRRMLTDWNQTAADFPRDRCVQELFQEQVERTPDAPAVAFGDRVLSYRELNRRANQLAALLREKGVGPETRVALCLERTPELVAAIWGILKAGGCYVPIDPSYPKDRQDFTLNDGEIRLVITQERFLPQFEGAGRDLLAVEQVRWQPENASFDLNPPNTSTPENLAYIIYTSGSTGRPKGAMIPHRGLVNYLSWCSRAYEAAKGGGAPVHSSIAFDLTVTGLFAPLLAGAMVSLLPESEGVEGLSLAMQREGPFGLVKITPAHLELLSQLLPEDAAAGRTRYFIIGGENLSAETTAFWRRHAPDTILINEYGPTETVVGCCVYQVPRDEPVTGIIPIGRPIANTQLYVLDAELQPVPPGVAGELFIGGECVGRGYWNRPELTAERFIPDPFSGRSGARLYKTGDRARYRADGVLECLGRLDHQTKIRGYRIELGEIEGVLKEQPGIRESIVLARDDAPEGKRLVAYLIGDGAHPLNIPSIREGLKRFLPDYMCPTAFVELKEWPLTVNGKVDRTALPPPDRTELASHQDFVAPRSDLEKAIVEVWKEVLSADRVGVNDNFFDLGGHSLLLTKVHGRLQELSGRQFPLVELFRHPTVASLAELLRGAGEGRKTFEAAQARARKQQETLARQK